MRYPDACAAREGGVRNRRPRLAVLIALSIAFSTLAVPALADVSPSDISAAESLAGEAVARLRVAESELAAAKRHLERLQESLVSVGDRLERQDAEIVEGRADALDRIARMYMTAGGSDTSGLLGLTRISDLPAHLAYLGALADQDRQFVNQLAATRADLERLNLVIEATVDEQTEAVSDLAELVEVRSAELEAARAALSSVEAQWQQQEAERRAREEAERVRQQQAAQEAERQRQEAAEQARQEEEQRQQAALAAMQAAASAASAAGWTPGSGVEPWRPLVQKHFPADMVDDALSVMRCESHGDPLSLNKYSAASGLFQHLPYYWPSRSKAAGWDGADIFDPEANIAVAAWLVNRTVVVEGREPWGHWVCKP